MLNMTPRSAWTGSNMCLIPKLNHGQIRNHGFFICDGFGTHELLEVMEYCYENNIILCHIPSHTSHKLQPCDVGVFGPLKAAYREQVERLYRGRANTVGKQHFISLYSRAREQVLTSRNIKSGWLKTGLYPFSLDRVFKDIQKPLAERYVPKDEVKVESCQQALCYKRQRHRRISLRCKAESNMMLIYWMVRANTACKNWLMPLKKPLLSAPSFSMRTGSCSSRTTKAIVANRLDLQWLVSESDEL
jgi:hypothetical protein